MVFGEVRIIYPDDREETIPLTKATVRLGRSDKHNDIVLVDSQVSRQHAELQCNGQGIRVMDLGSGNGVWLNGERLIPHLPTPLADGAVFTIGRVRFVLRVPAESAIQTAQASGTSAVPLSTRIPTTALSSIMVGSPEEVLAEDGPVPETEPTAIPLPEEPPVLSPAEAPPAPVVVTAQPPQIAMSVDPVDVEIEAGEARTFVVMVTNRSERVDAAVLHVDGVPSDWVTIRPIAVTNDQGKRNDRPTMTSGGLSLLPSYTGELHAIICPPRLPASRAGDYECVFRTSLTEQPHVTDQVKTLITIKPFVSVITNLIPEQQSARLRGRYQLEVDNQGNNPVDIDLNAADREDALRFTFQPKRPTVDAGTQSIVRVLAAPRSRRLFARPHTYRFTITTSPAAVVGQQRRHQGELALRWLPLWPFVLLAVLLLVALLLQPAIDLFKPVDPIQIVRGPISETLTVNGRVAPPAMVSLTFERDGTVEQILPVGTYVKEHEEVAHLRYYEQLRAIRMAEDNLRQAQLQLDLARRQHQNAVDAAKLELDKARAAAKRLAAGGADDPAQAAQHALEDSQRAAQGVSADMSIARLKAEDQLAQASIALQEAQQRYSRAQWEWQYVQDHGTDPNFVPEVNSNQDADGANTGGSQTEAPPLNDVQKQAFKDALDSAERAKLAAEQAVTAAKHELDRAGAAEIRANEAANASVQVAQAQVTSLKKGQQTPEQVAAQNAIDTAQLKLNSLSEPDLTAQLKAVADAERALEDARDKLERSRILAPAAGHVIGTSIITGGLAQTQVPVIQFALSDPNEVIVELTDAQIQSLVPSQSVTISITITLYTATGKQDLAGKLRRIESSASGATVTQAPGPTTAPQATNRVWFAFETPPKQPFTISDLASVQIKLEHKLQPDVFSVRADQVMTEGGLPFIQLRRAKDIGIAKLPVDKQAQVIAGVRSTDRVEIVLVNRPDAEPQDLRLCQYQPGDGARGTLSNAAIPDDCWIIIAPPAQ